MTIDPGLFWLWAIVTGALAGGFVSCLVYMANHSEPS